MNEPLRDSLDAAIDRVATRLVSVEHDSATFNGSAVDRLVSALPARREREWWNWSSWPAQAAVAASILLTILFVRMANDDRMAPREPGEAVAVLDARPMRAVAELHAVATAVDVVESVGWLSTSHPVQPAAARTSTAPLFGLELMPAPDSLSLSTLQTTAPLSAVEPATVAPIALGELQLGDIPLSSKE